MAGRRTGPSFRYATPRAKAFHCAPAAPPPTLSPPPSVREGWELKAWAVPLNAGGAKCQKAAQRVADELDCNQDRSLDDCKKEINT